MYGRYNRRGRRKYNLRVHIVLVTKYRKPLLCGSLANDVKREIHNICKAKDYSIMAMEADKDHIHLLVSYDATYSLTRLRKEKGCSSHHP